MIKEINRLLKEMNRILKKLQNYNCKLFLCPPQKQAKTQPAF